LASVVECRLADVPATQATAVTAGRRFVSVHGRGVRILRS
jgi:hypothetical protein